MTPLSLTRRNLLAAALAFPAATRAAAPRLQVVASFSILADLARQIGGDAVDVVAQVGPDGDAHVYEPTAQDARRLQQAQVLVRNGLGFEGWMPRLKSASGFRGLEVVAARGITARRLEEFEPGAASADGAHHQGQHSHPHVQDPHAWQDVRNAMLYVRNIADGFAQADPARAAHYRTHAAAYLARLDALDQRIRAQLAQLPVQRRRAVTNHDAFGYYAQAYGIRLVPARGLSTESELSARDMAALIAQIRKQQIPAVFIENIADPRLMQQLTRETGAVVGGTLYSDALSEPGGPAGDYIAFMESNTAAFLAALRPGPATQR